MHRGPPARSPRPGPIWLGASVTRDSAAVDFIALASELAEEFATRAAEVDRDARFPTENFDRLRDSGYLSMPVPKEFGGGGADLETVCQAQRVLAGGCGSTALAANMHLFGIGAAAEAYGAGEEVAAILLQIAGQGLIIGGSFTDAATGLNIRASSTPAKKVEGGYRISGRKAFCSLAPALDIFYGTAGVENGGPMIIFALPRDAEGLSFVDTWDTMSMRGTGSWDVVFDDVFVPELMAQEGAPWADWDDRSERMFSWFAFTASSVYLGIAEAAARFTYEYVANRQFTGMDYPLGRQPGMIFNAAKVEALNRPSRALLFDSIHRRREALLTPADIVAVKYVVTNSACQALDVCMGMAGGSAMYRRLPLERMYRDVRAGPLHPPTNDLSEEGLGKLALGIPHDAEPRWGS